MKAKVGDTVEVEISPVVTTLFPFIVFGIPVLSMFLGAILGSFISDVFAVILGAIFLLCGFLGAVVFNRYCAGSKKFRSRIVRVLNSA